MNVLGYTQDGSIRVVFDESGIEMIVPDDMGNRHRQMIAEWESDGNVIPPLPVDLGSLKKELRAMIDDEAESARLRYITGGAGQAMTYQRKVEEAKKAVMEVEPKPEDYPMLSASLGIDGETISDIALLVISMDAQWAITGSAIERARQTAKEAVNSAETEDDARAAAVVVWP